MELYRRYGAESEPATSPAPTQPVPVIEPKSTVKNNDRNRKRRTTPSLGPQRPTIPEKSAAEIVANLKGIKPSYKFHERVEELYLGRWTQGPGWQASVKELPSKLPGEHWFCSLKEVDSGTTLHAITIQDVSMLRIGDTVMVSGRISEVSQLEFVMLNDADVQSDDVPLL